MSRLEPSHSTVSTDVTDNRARDVADIDALWPGNAGVTLPITLTPHLSLWRLVAEGSSLVYEGFDRRLGARVAVKVLASARDADQRGRALRDAAVLANIDHPHLVQVHDVAALSDGTPYVVTDFVTGPTLAELMRGPSMGPALACEMASQLLSALVVLHKVKLPHGDLRPANVFVNATMDARYNARLVDVGLGKPDVLSENTLRRGGLAYLSPEQLAGAGPGLQADLFALGLVLHEMLTGVCPHAALPIADLASLRMREDIDDSYLVRAGVGSTLARFVTIALSRDPAARFSSAEEMRCELHAARADESCLWMLPSRGAQQSAVIESGHHAVPALESMRAPQVPLDSAAWDLPATDLAPAMSLPRPARSGMKALVIGFGVTLAAGGALLIPLQYPFESDQKREALPVLSESAAAPMADPMPHALPASPMIAPAANPQQPADPSPDVVGTAGPALRSGGDSSVLQAQPNASAPHADRVGETRRVRRLRLRSPGVPEKPIRLSSPSQAGEPSGLPANPY